MIGTILNVITVLIGGSLGSLLSGKLPQRIRQIVVQGIGLVTLALGVDMALETNNFLIVLLSMLVGGILGEWWQIQRRLDGAGQWLENKLEQYPFLTRGEFTRGFMTASLVFCMGPMTVLGSIQDGLTGDYTLLAIKSVLDGFTSLAFAAAMGMGVTFAALSVLLIQGALTLGASLLQGVLTDAMMAELSAVGGVMLLGLGLLMLEIKQIKVANFLPALLLAPLLVALWNLLGI